MKKVVLFIALSLTFLTCKKKPTETNATIQGTPTVANPALDEAVPVANFTSNKTEYEAGETVELTNTSTDANNVRWTLPDGTTSRQNTVSFTTYTNIFTTTNYNVSLEAISKSGLKSDLIVKAVKVNPGKGTLSLYSTFYLAINVDITIDGVPVNKANFNNYAIPVNCNNSAFSNYLVAIGTHTITYDGFQTNGNSFSGSKIVNITYGGCTKLNCN